MLYLFGDSTESKLDFDYLAFLRDVIDCSVVMLECEGALAATIERRRTRQAEAEAMVVSVEEFGKRAAEVVAPVVQEQAGTPVGRCAAAVAGAIKDSVDREAGRIQGALAAERAQLDGEDQRTRARAKEALEKLLRAHALPDAEQDFDVVWGGAAVKASMHERTSFGVEAELALDIPPGSLLAPDLRVERVADGVEVHVRDVGGWLKKADKLVPHKLGKYQVTGVAVAAEITVRLRPPDAIAGGLTITARDEGELAIEPIAGGPTRDFVIEERDRPALRALTDKLAAAARALGNHRAGLAAIEIEDEPIDQIAHPQLIAERFILAIAPTVHRIARHSRSPDELVLRRLLGDNRREEIFVSVAELTQRFAGLPPEMQDVFAPLQLGAPRPAAEFSAPVAAPSLGSVSAPIPSPAVGDSRSGAVPEEGGRTPPGRTRPPALGEQRRPTGRTTPPPLGLDRRFLVPAPDRARASRPAIPARPPNEPAAPEPAVFDDDEPTFMLSSAAASALAAATASSEAAAIEPPAHPAEDGPPPADADDPPTGQRPAALDDALDAALELDADPPAAAAEGPAPAAPES